MDTTINKILLITTGGTIAGKSINASKKKVDFTKIIQPSLQKIKDENKVHIEIDYIDLLDLDSSNILPIHWAEIANNIYESYDNYDAFIITHGTNTLGYTSSFLAFSFKNLNKPIILTGSQVPFGKPGSDAITNLENSLRVAILKEKERISGVSVVFGSHIISGVRAKKTTEFDYDAFKSFTTSSLGRIGRDININTENLKKHLSYLNNTHDPAKKSKDLILSNKFDSNIISLTEFPGLSSQILIDIIKHSKIRGIILRSFGAGDVSENLEEALLYLKKQNIPIVVTTQAPSGISNFLVNEPGLRLKENDLAIPSWDMSIESQTTKLSWLLGQGCSYEEIKQKMIQDLRGEINVTK